MKSGDHSPGWWATEWLRHAMTAGKTRVLIPALISRLDAGEQVNEAAPTTYQTHREKGGDTGDRKTDSMEKYWSYGRGVDTTVLFKVAREDNCIT